MKSILRKCLFLAALASGVLLAGVRDASACQRGWYGAGYYRTCGYTYPTCYGYQPCHTCSSGYTYPTVYTYQPYYTNPTVYTYQPHYSYPNYYVAGGRWRPRRWLF